MMQQDENKSAPPTFRYSSWTEPNGNHTMNKNGEVFKYGNKLPDAEAAEFRLSTIDPSTGRTLEDSKTEVLGDNPAENG